MDHLSFSVLCLLCLCARLFICALLSPAGKGLTYWLSFVVSNCEFCHIPIGILCQMWYLIVSIPDLCTLTYFNVKSPSIVHQYIWTSSVIALAKIMTFQGLLNIIHNLCDL